MNRFALELGAVQEKQQADRHVGHQLNPAAACP